MATSALYDLSLLDPPPFSLSSRASPIGARLSPDNLFSSAESWSPRDLCSPLPFAKDELSVHGQLNIPTLSGHASGAKSS